MLLSAFIRVDPGPIVPADEMIRLRKPLCQTESRNCENVKLEIEGKRSSTEYKVQSTKYKCRVQSRRSRPFMLHLSPSCPPLQSLDQTLSASRTFLSHSTTHTAQFFASRMSLVEVLPIRNSSALDL